MQNILDRVFFRITQCVANLPILLLIALIIALLILSWPAITQFKWQYLISSAWDPVNNQFGALPAIVGTLATSIIAILFAVPISFGIAALITYFLPHKIAVVLSRMIELMAAIPSIIYGMWGLFVLAPFIARYIQPPLIAFFAPIPLLNDLFAGLPIGIGIFTAGLILACMIIPLISSMMRDILATVPDVLIEAAYAGGATRYEVISKVILHYTRAGLFGSVILGLGRALGETMAVTFIIGNAHIIPQGLFMPATTISASIASEFTEATGKLYPAALLELSLILFFITSITLILARFFLQQSKLRGGSQ